MNILEARRRTLGGEVYKKTAEGNPVSVRSLARMRPGLNIFGRSTQNKTTGAQLFDVSAGGAGWIDTETGEFRSSQDNYVSDFIKVGPETQYYINNDAPLRYIYSYNIDKGFLRKESYDFIFVTGADVEYIRFAISDNAAGALKTANTVMLNAGSSALPWEPYTGGHPSPSPDYPQEITSVGDDGSIEVDVTGANLFDKSILLDYDSAVGVAYFPIKVDKEMDYTLSSPDYPVPVDQYNATNIFLLPGNVTSGASSAINGVWKGNPITAYGMNGYVTVAYRNRAIGSNLNDPMNYNFMLNKGSTALPWEPYKQPQSLTVQTPNGLPGIPVSSGGNYTDAEGQQWICDEIDFKRGKYVQRVAWVTFDGSEDESWFFTVGGPANTLTRGRVSMNGMCSQKKRNHVLCNRRIYSPATSYDTENACFSDRANIYIYGEKATEETELEWRQDLSEKPVTVLYELETPIETDLSQEQMQAYVNLHTNRPTTIVSATDDAGIKLTYKTKKSLEVTD